MSESNNGNGSGWPKWLPDWLRLPAEPRPAPEPEIDGWLLEEDEPDEDEVFARACAAWERTRTRAERQAQQVIRFEHGPIGLVGLADQHFGDSGVDYPRAFAEAELVAGTPGMYAILDGDLVNQFIIGTLRAARDGAVLGIPDEWALTRRYLRILIDSLLAACGGNHDWWHAMVSGVDYFEEVLRRVAGGRPVLYDPHQVDVTVQVGPAAFPMRIRHKWLGRSMYNPTHGIERGAREQGGFRIGWGAHTHEAGLARPFWIAGVDGVAVQLGSYKRYDDFARRIGFKRPNDACGVAIILHEDGQVELPRSLQAAAATMHNYWRVAT